MYKRQTQIDARLGGEQRAIPRIFGRPFELRPNQALTPAQLEQRLNDVGYASRTVAEKPGEFSIGSSVVVLRTRDDEPITARVEFSKGKMPVIAKLINQETGRAIPRLTLEAPMLTAIATALMTRLWRADLSAPFFYEGDSVSSAAHVKATLEYGWYE